MHCLIFIQFLLYVGIVSCKDFYNYFRGVKVNRHDDEFFDNIGSDEYYDDFVMPPENEETLLLVNVVSIGFLFVINFTLSYLSFLNYYI